VPVITLSRQVGSLGDEIGRAVSIRLGIRLVDQDILSEIGQRLGVPATRVSHRDERDPNIVSELVRTMRRLYPATVTPATSDNTELDPASYLQVTRQVIWEVARTGDVVIVGRGASFVLGEHPDTLHVLVVAPVDVRVERLMATDGLSETQARKRVAESDSSRARYIRRFYHANWLDLNNYDLVLNSGHFSELHATSLICSAVAGADPGSLPAAPPPVT
jgi:cytidylate kinase